VGAGVGYWLTEFLGLGAWGPSTVRTRFLSRSFAAARAVLGGEEMASFTQTIAQIRRGAFVEHVNDRMTKLLMAVAEHQADGELNVTLKFKHNAEGQVVCVPRCKTKEPTKTVGDAIFYVTEDGELERTDPRQGDFEFDGTKN
jgi:hypothetical protein